MDFAQKLVPPYFGHGEFKNQGFVAQQNGGGAIRGPECGRFSGNLLLLVWHTHRVFTVLGPVLKHIVTMANSPRRQVVRSSAGAGPGVVYPPFLGSFA